MKIYCLIYLSFSLQVTLFHVCYFCTHSHFSLMQDLNVRSHSFELRELNLLWDKYNTFMSSFRTFLLISSSRYKPEAAHFHIANYHTFMHKKFMFELSCERDESQRAHKSSITVTKFYFYIMLAWNNCNHWIRTMIHFIKVCCVWGTGRQVISVQISSIDSGHATPISIIGCP